MLNWIRATRAAARCAAAFAAVVSCATSAQGWTPARNVEIIVASGPGGSSDRTARVVQKLLQANPAFPSVSVSNRQGGGGTVAWTYLAQQPGNPHYIATFSPTMVSTLPSRNASSTESEFSSGMRMP